MSKELVHKILEKRNWSVADLAFHFGVNHSTAWRWVKNGPSHRGNTIHLLEQEWKRIERGKPKA